MRGVRVVSGVVVGAALVLAGCDSSTPDRDPVTELTLTVGSDQRDVPLSGVSCQELGDAVAVRSLGSDVLKLMVGPDGSGLALSLTGVTWYNATLADRGDGPSSGGIEFTDLSGALDDLPITRSDDAVTLDGVPVVNGPGSTATLSGSLRCPEILRSDGSGAGSLTLDGDADATFPFNDVRCGQTLEATEVLATTTVIDGLATVEFRPDGTAAVQVDLTGAESRWFNPAWTNTILTRGDHDDRFESLPVTVDGDTVTLDHVPVVNRDGDGGAGTVTGTLTCSEGHL